MRRSCLAGVALLLIAGVCVGEPINRLPLRELLTELANNGVRVVYSDDLVRADMLVDHPGPLTDIFSELAPVLAHHQLGLKKGPGGILLIVPISETEALGRLTGVVRSANGFRLQGATVSVSGGQSVRSDYQGRFEIAGIVPGEHQLLTSAPGYLSGPATEISVVAGKGSFHAIELSPLAPPIDLLTVVASRHELSFTERDANATFEQQDLEAMPNLAGEPLRALQRLPGTASGGLSARNHVRGGEVTEILVTLDGLRLYDPYHMRDFQSPASLFNRASVGRIDFFSGGFPARFGDRMSAVMAIELREPQSNRETEMELSNFNLSLTHLGRSEDQRSQWLASFRRGVLDWSLNVLDEDYGDPRYAEVLLHGSREFGRTTISGNLLSGYDDVSLRLDDTEQSDARYKNNYLWFRARTALNAQLDVSTLLSYTRIESERRGTLAIPGVVTGALDDTRLFSVTGARQDWRYAPHETLGLLVGFDMKRVEARYAYRANAQAIAPFDAIAGFQPVLARDIETDPGGGQYAAYADVVWQATDKLTFNAGARWDIQTFTTSADDDQVSPRLSVLYEPTDETQLRASWGRYYQAQEVNELQLSDGLDEFFPAQRSEHWVLSLTHAFTDALRLRAEAYQKRVGSPRPRFENVLNPLVLLPELHVDRVRIDASSARIRGFEFMLLDDDPERSWSWWINYSWSEAIDQTATGKRKRGWDQTHTVKAGVDWSLGPWQVNVSGSVHTGWPKSELRLINDAPESLELAIADGGLNSARYSVFHALDVRLSRDFVFDSGVLTGFVELSNLYNRGNPCCLDYEVVAIPDGTRELIGNERDWLPLLPTLGVAWRFH